MDEHDGAVALDMGKLQPRQAGLLAGVVAVGVGGFGRLSAPGVVIVAGVVAGAEQKQGNKEQQRAEGGEPFHVFVVKKDAYKAYATTLDAP